MSRAIRTAARAGGLAARVWRIHSVPRSTVNSMSWASRKWFSSRSATRERDLVEGPVVHRPLPVPRSEDGRHGFPQLLFHVRRKFLADLVAVQFLEIRYDRFQRAWA